MTLLAPQGRREANKARTREAVVQAATRLLQERGLDGLTAEQVAEAAGISRRTFFNYFASVEAVFAFQASEVIDELGAALASRPAEESLVDSAKAVVDATFTVEVLTEAERTWRVVDGCPGANRYVLEAHSAAIGGLARDWAAVRLAAAGQDTSPLRLNVLTAAALAAYDAARHAWLEKHTGAVDGPAREAFVACVGQALEYLRPAVEAR